MDLTKEAPTVPEPSEFESADALLEHIKAKCLELETWAHAALSKATEHVHAQPLGELVGRLSHTVKQLEGMQSTGVLFALEQPLIALLDDFETRLLETVGSRLDAKLDAHTEKMQSMLMDTIRAPALEPEPEPAPVPIDSAPETPPDASVEAPARKPYEAPAIIREEPMPSDVRSPDSPGTVGAAPVPFVPVEATPATLPAPSSDVDAPPAAAPPEPPPDAPEHS